MLGIAKKNKSLLFSALLLAFFVCPVIAFTSTGTDRALGGLNTTAQHGFNPGGGELNASVITDIPSATGRIIGAVLAFIGIVFFVLMIYAGFVWMFARGNPQDTQKAKDIIEASIIGLVIVMSAYAITSYVGSILTQ